MKTINGQCLCGSIKFTVTDNFVYSGYCHCSECRRWTGAPFSATAGVKVDDFQLLSGESLLTQFKKGENSLAHFCKMCSSIVYGEVPEYGMNFVFLGCLAEAPSLKPQWHIYTGSKAEWYEINDDLPQYVEEPNT
jgi:hypothetical protein